MNGKELAMKEEGGRERESGNLNLKPDRAIIIKLNEAPQLAAHIHDALREQIEL